MAQGWLRERTQSIKWLVENCFDSIEVQFNVILHVNVSDHERISANAMVRKKIESVKDQF